MQEKIMQFKLPPEFFVKVLKDYSDWRFAWIREVLQNSIDAKSNNISFTAIQVEDNQIMITVKDDGKGMSRDVLENGFMSLGGSVKEDDDAVGGFGVASMMIAQSHVSYRIKSHDYICKGQRGSYSIIDNETFTNGCEISVIMDKKNISEYSDTLIVTEDQMEGTPDWYKESMYDSTAGVYKIDISFPSRRIFMNYSESEETRRALSEKFLNRAADENVELIPKFLAERQKMAEMLGYGSYAAYVLEDRMPKTPETVWAFEEELINALKEKLSLELAELLEFKSKDEGTVASEIEYWELNYLENIRAEEKYQVDEEEVKQYFELKTVLSGLFQITQQVFGLTYKPIENPSVWHPEVLMYKMYDSDSGSFIGYFYLDLYPRANKYSHAAMFTMVKGKRFGDVYQLPIASLVTNFPKPSGDIPSLLSHDEAETFFHEFGHLIHGLVTTADYYVYSGTGVDRDFVEAPSQIMENWVWNKKTLRLFAKHYETGETIPDDLLDRMLAAKNKSSAGNYAFQVFLGTLDLTLHDGKWDPNNETVVDVAHRLHKDILSWNETPKTARIASFGHLAGYAAGYYGYAWSSVLAQDMFSVFEEEGVLNPETGRRFREIVLAPGGSKDPMDLVREFLGREPNNDAFMKSLGL